MKTCVDLLKKSEADLDAYKGKQIRLLKLKILSSLCVYSVKLGDSELAEAQRRDLLAFLLMQKDASLRFFEVKAAIKLILGVGSVDEFGSHLEEETEGVSRSAD